MDGVLGQNLSYSKAKLMREAQMRTLRFAAPRIDACNKDSCKAAGKDGKNPYLT